MLDQTTTKGRIIAAAMKCAETRRWSEISLYDIAEEAGVGLDVLRANVRSKGAILAAFMRAVDDEVLKRAPKREEGTTARDRLFDVIMTRFDVLAPYKPALRNIVRDAPTTPELLPACLCAQHWMLAAAGIGTDGLEGAARMAGLGAIYARVFAIWLEEEDPSSPKTMAALDRRLARAEGVARRLHDFGEGARRMICAVAPKGLGRICRARSGMEAPAPESGAPSPSGGVDAGAGPGAPQPGTA